MKMKMKVVAVAAAVAAFVAGPVGAAPAQAQATCTIFTGPPEYVCVTAWDTYNFVRNEGNQAYAYVTDLAADTVFAVACLAFPTRPECQ